MPALQVPPGVEGIVALYELPDDAWRARWSHIVVPDGTKERLLNFTLLSLRHRARVDAVQLPLHGLVVLAGPPGTGKTTLAHGLADAVARELGGALFVEIDPHRFPSQLLGESQRGVARLFERTLPDIAARGKPVLVLLDEVEALAVSRARASLDTNPVDVHRATDAVLEGVDQIARACPNMTFVATTNYPEGVDEAFVSRADLVEHIGLPTEDAVAAILHDTLKAVAPSALVSTPLDADVGEKNRTFGQLARDIAAANLDGRQIRKLVLRALASRRELADDPSKLRVADVAAVLRSDRP